MVDALEYFDDEIDDFWLRLITGWCMVDALVYGTG
jgi:hypothetical protein